MIDDSTQRLFWWKEKHPPTPERIAAQVMVLGNLDDIRRVRELYGDQIFHNVLAHPPKGLFDAKSWVFWHKKLKLSNIQPLPAPLVDWSAS